MGMEDMVKYLLSISKDAEQPPLLAQTTDAPIFMLLSKVDEWKSLSRNEMSVPFGEA
jgi:hypothetical protein